MANQVECVEVPTYLLWKFFDKDSTFCEFLDNRLFSISIFPGIY